jgi:hypothetical protein
MQRGAIVLGVLLAVGLSSGAYALDGGQSLGAVLGPEPPTQNPATPAPADSAASSLGPTRTATASATPTPSPTATPSPTPTPADPDRDNLATRYEKSVGTDPMQKTVLLAVNYTSGTKPLSEGDRSFLKAKFEELKVVNPDGTTGVNLHIVEEWNSSGNAAVDPTTLQRNAIQYLAGRTPAEPCRHHYLLVGAPSGRRWGVANTAGWVSIVKSDTTGFSGSREDVIVHELLHNLVGNLDTSRSGVRPDGSHTNSGWLQPVAEMGGPSSLHSASREKLNEYGFANGYASEPGCL